MTNAVVSVIIAASQSVAKVYVIGAIGYASVKFPRNAPLLPSHAVGVVARFGFNILVISLIYSVTAISITPSSIGEFWPVMVAAFLVIAISYAIATILGYVLRIKNPRDFSTLRIAATFPNIVALPILIFPSLCEYSVVYEGYGGIADDPSELKAQCVARSNTMIFCYFFSWSLCFYSVGYPQLMAAANLKVLPNQPSSQNQEPNESESSTTDVQEANDPESDQSRPTTVHEMSTVDAIRNAIRQTFTSAGFIAIVAGFITGCIPPLQSALFHDGGALRFLGSAIETLGKASTPISTMVVAASLVPRPAILDDSGNTSDVVREESPIMSDPNFGPYQRRHSIQEISRWARRRSSRFIQRAVARSASDQFRLLSWFVLSRLVFAPAIVVAIVVGLDCGGILSGVSDLAKLVVIVNSCLPGALIVVVLLKSNEELADTAAAVARVYLPSYLLSIFSIAAWTALGLWVTLPDENGNTICDRSSK